jgi:hypothetical protein
LNMNFGASAQKENKQIQSIVSVGDHRMCPECRTIGCVVWLSQDKKTMGVQCHKSHREASRPAFKYGATLVPSTKTRKNIVFLTGAV